MGSKDVPRWLRGWLGCGLAGWTTGDQIDVRELMCESQASTQMVS